MKTDNELIAEFMGLERAKANQDFFFIAEYHAYVSPENILYHKSWDWLMPVVEKIRKDILKKLQVTRPPNSACKGDLIDVDISCGFMEVDIAMVYNHVVTFIKWYNENVKNSN